MPALRDKAHRGILCKFGTKTSAIEAAFARFLQLSSSRPEPAVQSVRSVMESGMDRPSQHKSYPAGSLSSSQPGGHPFWVITLAFGLIGGDASRVEGVDRVKGTIVYKN
jgi:hypothetical protein